MTKGDKKHGKNSKGAGVFSFKTEMREEFLNTIRIGASPQTAAAYVGISHVTVHKWLRIGREHREADKQSAYSDFSKSFEQAIAQCEVNSITSMQSSGASDWKMHLAKLERLRPQQWAKRTVVSSDPGDLVDSPVDAIDLDKLTDEQLAQFIALLQVADTED